VNRALGTTPDLSLGDSGIMAVEAAGALAFPAIDVSAFLAGSGRVVFRDHLHVVERAAERWRLHCDSRTALVGSRSGILSIQGIRRPQSRQRSYWPLESCHGPAFLWNREQNHLRIAIQLS